MEPRDMYKQYVIEYATSIPALQERLAPYEHFCSELAPYCTVTLYSQDEEKSLLEVLASVEGVTYREALRRKALGDARVRRETRADDEQER